MKLLPLLALVALLPSCSLFSKGPTTPTTPQWLRAGVVLTAKAVLAADVACADAARTKLVPGDAAKLLEAKATAEGCSKATHVAATALEGAEASIDAYQDGQAGKVACAAAAAFDALLSIKNVVVTLGQPMPTVVEHGIAIARELRALDGALCPNGGT